MSQPVVDIHMPGQHHFGSEALFRDGRLSRYGRLELGEKLQELGALVTYSRHTSETDENGLPLVHPAEFRVEDDQPVAYLKRDGLPFSAVGAVRNVSKTLGHDAPELNPVPVRRLARDKALSNYLLTKIGAGKTYAAWDIEAPLDSVFDKIEGDEIVIKRRFSSRGVDFMATTKQRAAAMLAAGELTPSADWMVEERLDLSLPLPVVARGAQQQAKLNQADALGLPKELRAYCFGREGSRIITSYLVRLGNHSDSRLGNDNWVFIDSDSLPPEPQQLVTQGLSKLETWTGHREMNVAFDLVLARRHQETDAQWVGMKINAGEPQLVTLAEDRQVGEEHRTKLAKQLLRVAAAGGTA